MDTLLSDLMLPECRTIDAFRLVLAGELDDVVGAADVGAVKISVLFKKIQFFGEFEQICDTKFGEFV